MPSHSTEWYGSTSSRMRGRTTPTSLHISWDRPLSGAFSTPATPAVQQSTFGDADERSYLLSRSQTFASSVISEDDAGHQAPSLGPRRRSGGGNVIRRKFSRSSMRLWDRASRVSDWMSGGGTPRRPDDKAMEHQAGYDAEFREELAGQAGVGMRVWYDTFTSIDWLHDAVKEDWRRKRLQGKKGIRGKAALAWDRSQGWVIVTLIGLITALAAGAIVNMEMWLFDLKEGYCTTNWKAAKRFCCKPPTQTPGLAMSPVLSNTTLSTLHGSAFASPSFIGAWSASNPLTSSKAKEEPCSDWRTWSEVFEGKFGGEGAKDDNALVDWAVLLFWALLFATIASVMTVYLTSSDDVFSSKDLRQRRMDVKEAEDPEDGSGGPAKRERPERGYGATSICDSPEGMSSSRPCEPSALLARPRKTLYFAAGSGIPEIKTILSGFVIRGYLGSWTLVTKGIGLAFSVASGLTLGKEGPFVHIASCIGNILTRLFSKFDRNEGKRREILSAACAAGVAVAFGAPIGGVLFSLEEVSYYFPARVMWRSFWCAMVAAATLRALNPFGTGKTVLFEVTYDREWHFVELIGFACLGVMGGVIGAYLSRANAWWAKNVRAGTSIRRHPIIEVLLVTSVTIGAAVVLNPWLKMGGTELVYELLAQCKDREFNGLCVNKPSQVGSVILILLASAVAKSLLFVITFGIRLPAGAFIPALSIGALIGRASGLGVEYLYHLYPKSALFDSCRSVHFEDVPFGQACVLPAVWGLIGASAVLAGVTRTTVSLAVIVMELTGSLTYVLPIMLSVLIAKVVGDAIEIHSIYDLVIAASDLPFLDAKTEYTHDATPADIMDTEATVIELNSPENTIGALRDLVADLYESGAGGGFPIVTSDAVEGEKRIVGYIGLSELDHALGLIPLTDDAEQGNFALDDFATHQVDPSRFEFGYLVDHAPVTVSTRSPMVYLHQLFVRLGVRYIVIQDVKGQYRGLIEKNRWLRYLSWMEERQKNHGGTDLDPSVDEP